MIRGLFREVERVHSFCEQVTFEALSSATVNGSS